MFELPSKGIRVKTVFVTGSFDDLRSADVRFLQEAACLGPVHVLLRSDAAIEQLDGRPPKFPEAERQYVLGAIRYVDRVTLRLAPFEPNALPSQCTESAAIWAVPESDDTATKRAYCRARGLEYRVLATEALAGLPENSADGREISFSRKRVLVTGCYDWFHSGHVRFFEEVSELGDLYVVVGHDANIRLLKGDGHPLFPEQERRYLVQAVRFVKLALISTGDGWLDAEPEIRRLRPHVYAVNEDGDRPEKREYCESHGIEYRVLKRLPKEGLAPRQSTVLRGF
jgi:cytidyltransferase-like protein